MDQNLARNAVDAGTAFLPPPMPLVMPVQSFATGEGKATHADLPVLLSRVGLFGGTFLLTVLFTWQLRDSLSFEHAGWAQLLFVGLSTLAFAWMAFSSLSALLGCLIAASGVQAGTALPPTGRISTRVALLFPVHEEPPERIADTIDRIADELTAMGKSRHFDVFILSDSRTDEAWRLEAEVFAKSAVRLLGKLVLHYRRRSRNTGRKAGNIADWIVHFGGGYDAFVVLDADSVMSGELLVRLARGLEMRPRAGLIQTVPRLVDETTLFQRLQRFASWVYGPSTAAGLASWYGPHGNYWGHNAIVRTQAFATSAGLPVLKGRPPFGGHILSHDFVEAALLQRHGWEVLMVPEVKGSYEGSPPNLVEHVRRDRRWAQGNLQHLGILFAPIFTGLGRCHLALGAAAYIVTAIWASSLCVGVLISLESRFVLPRYFPETKTLFPVWPIYDSEALLRLVIGTLTLLFLPKLAALAVAMARAPTGRLYLLTSAVVELAFAALLAPIMMVSQTRALAEILMGRDAGWQPQRREGGRVSVMDAVRFSLPHTVLGVLLAVACSFVSLEVILWMSPILLGLLLAAPLVYLTAQPMMWLDLSTAQMPQAPATADRRS